MEKREEELLAMTLNFTEAIDALKQGFKVIRNEWGSEHLCYVNFYGNDQFEVIEKPDIQGTLMPIVFLKNRNNQLVPWEPNLNDFGATDYKLRVGDMLEAKKGVKYLHSVSVARNGG